MSLPNRVYFAIENFCDASKKEAKMNMGGKREREREREGERE